jgi:DHA1 family tetracycline resistance protein-like MFS transporter
MAENEFPNPQITEPEMPSPLDVTPAAQLHALEAEMGPDAPKGRKAAATFVFMTVALDMLALGMIAPVLPTLLESFMRGTTSDIAAQAANMIFIFGTMFAGIQFVFSPVLGSLSDRYGRRPIILLSNFGLGCDYFVMALAPTLPWLFLGRVISGFTASSVPTAMAYMADVTPKEKRAGAFGMLSAAFAIGFVLGPAMGGVLGNHDPRYPFWVAGCLSLINGMYGLFVLPESLPKERRSAFSWQRANPVGSLQLFRSVKGVLPLAGLLLLGYIAQQSLMNTYALYAGFRFDWSPRSIGLSLGLVGICAGLYGGFLVKRVVARWGERVAMLIGYCGGAIGFSILGLASVGWAFLLAIPMMNMMSLAWPSAQALMSRNIPADRQGQLQGAINSLRGIAGLIGPFLFTWLFEKSVSPAKIFPLPGTLFLVAAGLLIVALLLTATVLSAGRKEAAVAA